MNLPTWMIAVLQRPFWVVLGGTGFAQVLLFSASPLLARFYTPESFGLLTVFSTTLGLLTAFMGGRYEYAIAGEQDDREADALIVLVACAAFVTGGLSSVLMLLPQGSIPDGYRVALPALLMAGAAYVVGIACNNWLVRRGMFAVATGLKVFRVMATLALSLLFIPYVTGLVWGAAGAYLLLSFAAIYACLRRGWLVQGFSFTGLAHTARSHFKFPVQSALPAVLDNLSMMIPIYWASSLFSADDVGQWGLSRMVLAMPLGMVAASTSQILMKRLHDLVAEKCAIDTLLRGVFIRFCVPMILLCLVVSVLGENIFRWVFGDRWGVAGALSAWLIWAYAINTICSMLSVIFIVLRKLALNGLWQTGHCIAIYLLFSLSNIQNFDHFIRLFVVIEVISYGIYGYLVYVVYRHYGQQLNRENQAA